MNIGICKFCGEEKKLINSHIIPKCFYRLHETGGISVVNVKEKKIDRDPKQQKGLTEPLMCKDCDNKIGTWDGYANKILTKVIPKAKTMPVLYGRKYEKAYILEGKYYDYDKLRLFFISLIWRASICSSYSFSLGQHEKTALRILRSEIQDNDQLFLPIIFRRGGNIPTNFITGIFDTKHHGKETCIIKFPNYELMISANPRRNATTDYWRDAFSRDIIMVIEITQGMKTDYQLARGFIEARDAFLATNPRIPKSFRKN